MKVGRPSRKIKDYIRKKKDVRLFVRNNSAIDEH